MVLYIGDTHGILEINKLLDFNCWYFGHFHTDNCFKDERGKTYICSYHKPCF